MPNARSKIGVNPITKSFFFRFCALLIVHSIIRIIFWYYNADLFQSAGDESSLKITLLGVWFDAIMLLYYNAPFLILALIPTKLHFNNILHQVVNWGFGLLNALLIILAMGDIVYYRFTYRRTTADVLDILGSSIGMFGSFLIEYWPIVILSIILLVFLFIIIRAFDYSNKIQHPFSVRTLLQAGLIAGLSFFVARGFGIHPVTPLSANLFVRSAAAPLVTNTPFTFLYSFYRKSNPLEQKNYFKNQSTPFKVFKSDPSPGERVNKNVVVFIMESFSKEFLEASNPYKAHTPFLDYLKANSFDCTNAYANGTSSGAGLVAILGSMPQLIDSYYGNSIYAGNSIKGIGEVLGDLNYEHRALYIGCADNTFGFNKSISLFGVPEYIGKKQCNCPQAHDGSWGVFDGPFFQFMAGELNTKKEPFFALSFNVSSHHPYKIPKQFKDSYPKGFDESHQALSYVDDSYRKLFDTIKGEKWFNNTLFVFVADHVGRATKHRSRNSVTNYQIPLFIYDPTEVIKGSYHGVAQQTDILPTIYDALNIPEKHFTFGQSLLDTNRIGYAINRSNNVFQIISDQYLLRYDEQSEKSIGLFDYQQDSILANNIIDDNGAIANNLEMELKAQIQAYNNALIKNKMLPNN